MVDVIVPLRYGIGRSAVLPGLTFKIVRLVLVVLEDQVHMALLLGRQCLHRVADFLDDVGRTVVADRVDGVEAQAVEAEFLDPVERVVDEEIAHGTGIVAVEVDRCAPGRMVARVEEFRAVAVQVVAFGAEVVVNDVEEDHQVARMGGIDQALEVFGGTVGSVGGEGQHAIVAPAAAAGKVRDRHDLERGDAEAGEVIEPRLDAGEIARWRESTDM